MSESLSFFLSNRLEILYDHLKNKLFFDGPVDPFKKRIVVVYGPAIKSWLTLRMAEDPDLGIAAGIEIIPLNGAFEKILSLQKGGRTSYVPNPIELACSIEHEIKKIMHAFSTLEESEKEIWLPLISYLLSESFNTNSLKIKFTRRIERRIVGLSQQLASCFMEYSSYAQSMLLNWEFQKNSAQHWQELLWRRLFLQKEEWTYFNKEFQKPIAISRNIEIHFFSISFINRSEFDFLNKLSNTISLSYYLLSPCALFWSDIRSDKESMYIHRNMNKKGIDSSQVLEFEEFLRERNPLLANFGRLGREMMTLIEKSDSEIEAKYILDEAVKELYDEEFITDDITFIDTERQATLLQALQLDILSLRNPEDRPKIVIKGSDKSIQLHNTPTKRREIEILYHNLLAILEDGSIKPSDVIVSSPNILEYVPYIKSIFGYKKSLLNFQILDLDLVNQSEIAQAFLQLIKLGESRWDAKTVLGLINHKSFQSKHSLSSQDVEQIHEWIEKVGIKWGETVDHKNELLKEHHCEEDLFDKSEVGTWEYGLSRLLFGLITFFKNDPQKEWRFASCSIEFSQGDLLGKVIALLYSLRDDLQPLKDQSQLTLVDWSNYLTCLLDSYFSPYSESLESESDFEKLKQQFEYLGKCGKSLSQAKFSFETIKTHLNSLLNKGGVTFRENDIDTVKFCSIVPLRSLPAKVIAFIGMQEGAFPRPSSSNSLNLSRQNKTSDYCPNTIDFDRYLFLESIHAAQNYLIFSYQGTSHQDGKELQPSLVVEELFNYLNSYYLIEDRTILESCVHKHPFDSFHFSYFQKDSGLNNFSYDDYIMAETFYNAIKKPFYSLIEYFKWTDLAPKDVFSHGTCIDIKHLSSAAKNPIKLHLNRGLEIYLQSYEDREIKSEESLQVSSLDKYLIKQNSLKNSVENTLQKAEKKGQLPLGLFKEIASKQIHEEIADFHAALKKHHLVLEDLFQIEFHTACEEPVQLENGHWVMPPLAITYSEDYQINIVGKIENVSKKGLVVAAKNGTISEIWKFWPQFLIYLCAIKKLPEVFEKQLILINTATPKKAFFDDPEPYLKQFIAYYGYCLNHFSPLYTDWITPILDGDENNLRNKMEQLNKSSFFGHLDISLQWAMNKDRIPSASSIISEWNNPSLVLLGDIKKHWYAAKDTKKEEVNESV